MRINRHRLTWFLKTLTKERKALTEEQLSEKIASYLEKNPSCINPYEPPATRKRFSYSTVGYGIFSLLGEKYRMGRIEIFDRESTSSYQIDEGTYCMPHETAAQFEDFIENLETDLPIQVEMGRVHTCEIACAEALGLSKKEDLRDEKIIEELNKNRRDSFAQSEGYENWDSYIQKNPFPEPQSKPISP